MKYRINVNKTINQLVPYYLGGRKLILYLQAILQPLQSLNNLFADWAFEKRVEAAMTSQLFKFEWFLNWKFSKYFQNKGERIAIHNSIRLGTVLYWENAQALVEHQVIRQEDESELAEDNMVLYHSDEDDYDNDTSFIVSTPAIDTTMISVENYLSLLTYQIDKYKIAGKTYSIKFNNETL